MLLAAQSPLAGLASQLAGVLFILDSLLLFIFVSFSDRRLSSSSSPCPSPPTPARRSPPSRAAMVVLDGLMPSTVQMLNISENTQKILERYVCNIRCLIYYCRARFLVSNLNLHCQNSKKEVQGSQEPRYLKVIFKYELDSIEGPSCNALLVTSIRSTVV